MSNSQSLPTLPDEPTPIVSVIISAYNSEAHIETTLRTVLQQTFRDFEIIVVNDGSQDRTAGLVRNAADKDLRIKLIEQANRGIAGARNTGIAAAGGNLIAFLDDDDRWHPEKLQLQVEYMIAHPGVSVVNCYSALIDSDGCCLGWRFGGPAHGNVYHLMLEQDLVAGGSVAVVRSESLQSIGAFDESVSLRCDWDMWLRFARDFSFGTVAKVLVGYTRETGSESHDYEAMTQVGSAVLDKISQSDPDFGDSEYTFCLARDTFAVACLCLVDNNVRQAWKYLYRSLTISPRPVLSAPRRLGVVVILTLSTLLPRSAFRSLFSGMSRSAFNLRPGQPFAELFRSRDDG